jgi:hypothetical protein
MSGAVPEMYWYLFWVGVLAWMIIFAIAMMTLIHRGHMKTLELLRLYAEKGIDPPPALEELLARTSGGPEQKWKSGGRGAMRSSQHAWPAASRGGASTKAARRW